MSAEVSVHLFYGLFVTTSSLYVASEAFKKVQGPLLAIQLLLLRKSASTLQITKSERKATGYIVNLPVEVWTMIKLELIGIELIKAQLELANRYVCYECKASTELHRLFKHCATAEQLKIATCWVEFLDNDCDGCYDNVRDTDPWLDLDVEPLQNFLGSYLLQLYPNNVDDNQYSDFNPLSAIGIQTTKQECHDFDDSTPFHAVTTLSPATFQLPFSDEFISRQFKALRRDYDVEFGDHRTKTSQSQTTPRLVADESGKVKKDLTKDLSIPSWQLWTRGEIMY